MKTKKLLALVACSAIVAGCGVTPSSSTSARGEMSASTPLNASERYALLNREIICVPCEFNTYTQGGWGSPENSEPGMILDNLFDTGAITSISVGCDPGFEATFTSADAIREFLPFGSTPGVLDADYTDPEGSDVDTGGVFVAQLLALALNLELQPALAQVEIVSGDFAGYTIGDFFEEANDFLGGCLTTSSFTASQYSDQAARINEFFNSDTGPVTPSGEFDCPSELLPVE